MAMVWASGLAKNRKMCLLAYADHANDDGTSIYPGEDIMSDKTSDSTGNVRRVTGLLIDDGFLEQVKRGHRGQRAEYRIVVDALDAQIARHSEELKGARDDKERRAKTRERRALQPRKARTAATPNHQEPSEPSENRHLAAKPRNVAWDFLTDRETFGLPTVTATQRTRVGRLARELNASITDALLAGPATYDDMFGECVRRAATWPTHFPDATLTADAFVKHFELLGAPPLRQSKGAATRAETRAAMDELARSRQ